MIRENLKQICSNDTVNIRIIQPQPQTHSNGHMDHVNCEHKSQQHIGKHSNVINFISAGAAHKTIQSPEILLTCSA